ncbi:hypothetical protein H696_05120 [Fonticula alba]|uniref:Uncharacterized protein n=1 Tax=Fonticula alba TaxID=691883 RepID=A0A058Z225_FONAL|nr:hypothetical protein H696_05120 [Fonticula alba]KCV68191.1 hypothetical protein H696_05120 [Fonticula alba]|eukprot:XP_009497245.1 hypothetical protein H696_05120 [Fonticula alba]
MAPSGRLPPGSQAALTAQQPASALVPLVPYAPEPGRALGPGPGPSQSSSASTPGFLLPESAAAQLPAGILEARLMAPRSDTPSPEDRPAVWTNFLQGRLAAELPHLSEAHYTVVLPVEGAAHPPVPGHTCHLWYLHYADSLDDLWTTVRLLRDLSREHDVAISVRDTDGDFLLIEAASLLPAWLDSENSTNRTFLYGGRVRVLADMRHLSAGLAPGFALSCLRSSPPRAGWPAETAAYLDALLDGPQAAAAIPHSAAMWLPAGVLRCLERAGPASAPALVHSAAWAFALLSQLAAGPGPGMGALAAALASPGPVLLPPGPNADFPWTHGILPVSRPAFARLVFMPSSVGLPLGLVPSEAHGLLARAGALAGRRASPAAMGSRRFQLDLEAIAWRVGYRLAAGFQLLACLGEPCPAFAELPRSTEDFCLEDVPPAGDLARRARDFVSQLEGAKLEPGSDRWTGPAPAGPGLGFFHRPASLAKALPVGSPVASAGPTLVPVAGRLSVRPVVDPAAGGTGDAGLGLRGSGSLDWLFVSSEDIDQQLASLDVDLQQLAAEGDESADAGADSAAALSPSIDPGTNADADDESTDGEGSDVEESHAETAELAQLQDLAQRMRQFLHHESGFEGAQAPAGVSLGSAGSGGPEMSDASSASEASDAPWEGLGAGARLRQRFDALALGHYLRSSSCASSTSSCASSEDEGRRQALPAPAADARAAFLRMAGPSAPAPSPPSAPAHSPSDDSEDSGQDDYLSPENADLVRALMQQIATELGTHEKAARLTEDLSVGAASPAGDADLDLNLVTNLLQSLEAAGDLGAGAGAGGPAGALLASLGVRRPRMAAAVESSEEE